MSSLVWKLHDAAVSPEAWPDALKALTDAMGIEGAAVIISNKHTGKVVEVCFCGLSAAFKSDYVGHYSELDQYSPMLDGSWKKLSDCLPKSLLRKSEWYNDFVLACGVHDILAARLVDTPNHTAIIGLHRQIGRSFSHRVNSVIDLVATPLRQAARRHTERLFSPGAGPFDHSPPNISDHGNRFYFHIDNHIDDGSRYPDETGTVFSTPSDAAAHALILAKELAQDISWQGFSVRVTNDQGQEITRVRIGA
jgi:hypothetical protein